MGDRRGLTGVLTCRHGLCLEVVRRSDQYSKVSMMMEMGASIYNLLKNLGGWE